MAGSAVMTTHSLGTIPRPHSRRRLRTAVALLTAAGCLGVPSILTTHAHGAFPGENGLIFYETWGESVESGASDGEYEIFAADPSSAVKELVTASVSGHAFEPAVSPDGKRVAFVRSQGRSQDLYVMNIDGSRLTRLTRTKAAEVSPTWSPDGKRLSFARRVEHKDQIFVMSLSRPGKARQITHVPEHAWYPEWSPAGGKIAFSSVTEGGSRELFTVSPRGKELRRLTYGGVVTDSSWSPDGRMIAWTDWKSAVRDPNRKICYPPMAVPGAPSPCQVDVYAMDLRTLDEQRLTDASGFDGYPSWSPDGTKIAFVSDRMDRPFYNDIWMMNADGTAQERLIDTPYDSWSISWQAVRR